MESRHVLLVTYPAQGHINPSLHFAGKLIHLGIDVTFVTTLYARRRMAESAAAESSPKPKGLTFVAYSDGNDDGRRPKDDGNRYMTELRNRGRKYLKELILAASESGRPFTCLVYSLLLPWAAMAAREAHLPSALLWIQPATVLNAYYNYFNGSLANEIKSNCNDSIQFPGIPLTFTKQDLPSFIIPSSSEKEKPVLSLFQEQFSAIETEENPTILVNTFDALEFEALKSIPKYNLIGVGPLNIPSENSISGDLFRKSDDYIEWLNTKEDSSVVYVSFGSMLTLPKPEMEEIARGLLNCKRPFLWVIRVNDENREEDGGELSCKEELERVGKIVQWCSQLEVLRHPSVGCFVTHCGWNSTLESLCCGVPVVGVPRWSDQGTNAKMVEDLWKTGVRVRVGEDGGFKNEEIEGCVERVMRGGEFRENARKWMVLAQEAGKDDGSSCKNLRDFLEEILNVDH